MSESARIEAEVTFIPAREGGRETPPRLVGAGGSYRPHIVVGDPKQRRAIVVGNSVQETYLGVVFLSGPEQVEFSTPFVAEMELPFYPYGDYDSLVPGATFTIREGPKVVGFGEVKKALLPNAESLKGEASRTEL